MNSGSKSSRRGVWAAILAAVFVTASCVAVSLDWHEPLLSAWKQLRAKAPTNHDDHGEHDHAGHDHDGLDQEEHDHEGHDHDDDAHEQGQTDDDDHDDHDHEADHDHLDLTEQAQGNLGIEVATLAARPYQRTIAVPAVVVERPGVSRVEVSAPLTGIVTRVERTEGESVGPDEPLFRLRLTHEELVATQREYLATLEELDVLNQEIDRLEVVTATGAVAGKTLLERQYEKRKKTASLKALREALLLHGLTEELVDSIEDERRLVKEIPVNIPDAPFPSPLHGVRCCFNVQKIFVNIGKHVNAGDTMAVLTDYTKVYIEGRAFQRDAAAIERAAAEDWSVTAQLESSDQNEDSTDELKIAYVANEVDVESRGLHFYVELPNELLKTHEKSDGRRFSQWKYRPGQRGQLFIPAEVWSNQLVVPVDAVVRDGAESFVFLVHGEHYDRTPVRVLQRDQRFAVLSPDEKLQPGEQIVVDGAYQMHLAMKNQSGGGIDPHAGHNH